MGENHTHDAARPHVHDAQEKRKVVNRLSRIIGHLEAVKRMVENDSDCSEVLIQLSAVRSALNGAGRMVLKSHIDSCIREAVEEGDNSALDALDEAIEKYLK